jgi:hypothetical protein
MLVEFAGTCLSVQVERKGNDSPTLWTLSTTVLLLVLSPVIADAAQSYCHFLGQDGGQVDEKPSCGGRRGQYQKGSQ